MKNKHLFIYLFILFILFSGGFYFFQNCGKNKVEKSHYSGIVDNKIIEQEVFQLLGILYSQNPSYFRSVKPLYKGDNVSLVEIGVPNVDRIFLQDKTQYCNKESSINSILKSNSIDDKINLFVCTNSNPILYYIVYSSNGNITIFDEQKLHLKH